ncbi:MAG: MG2 domain-containing protein, partial [Myxococcota bacterium]
MHHRSILTGTGVLAALSMACLDRATADVDTTNLAEAPISTHEAAPKASPRVADNDFSDFQNQIDEHFEGRGDRRMYLQVDKPLYQPSETIWLRTWDLRARDLAPIDSIVKLELVDPRGSVVLSKTLDSKGGAENDLILPADIAGGEYILRIQELEEVVTERPIIVQRFEAPRVKKTLEFLRKAYGPGETAAATLSIKRPTGDPLANQDVVGVVQLDGQEIERVSATTDAEGGVIVQFALPDRIQTGDGTLTVLVKDGGVTESISRRVPIVLDRMRLNFYPEGGDLVEGLSSRVYFSATNLLGKPADVEGIIRDGRGQTVATFRSIHDGMGRFSFTPEPGQTYAAEITSPSSVKGTYRLPDAQADGCVLRTYDDFDSVEDTVRVGVWCRDNRTVRVQAVMRDDVVDGAAVQAGPERPGVVYLQTDPDAQGVARVTVFDDQMSPLAERLVFRNRTQQLQVTVEADKETYTPREQVSLTVTAKDARGEPVEAELALAVVDDTVLSFADDKQGHLLSRLFLESELHESVEEPNHYFDVTEANAGAALDSLLGTRGWRRFEWKPLLEAPPEPAYVRAARQWEQQKQLHNLGYLGYLDGAEMEDDRQIVLQAAAPMRPRRRLLAGVAKPAPPMDAPMAAPMAEPAKKAEEAPAVPEMDIAGEIAPNQQGLIARDLMFGMRADRDQEWDGGLGGLPANAAQLSPVRVFPAPKYDPDYEGPRSDFRQTIHWAPRVKTDASGQAKVSFHTSDAITSFRVTAEGVGGNLAGRAEEVFESSLPFSMNVKLPVAVTEGDQILLPLTLSNERERGTTVNVSAQFGVSGRRIWSPSVTATGSLTFMLNGRLDSKTSSAR